MYSLQFSLDKLEKSYFNDLPKIRTPDETFFYPDSPTTVTPFSIFSARLLAQTV